MGITAYKRLQLANFSSIEPIKLIILREDSPISLPAIILLLLLGVDAVQLGGLVAAGDEDAEVDVRRPRLGHGVEADLAEEVDAVGGFGDADRLEVVDAEAR